MLLVLPVPSGASGVELSRSGTIAGMLSRVTPVHIHLFQIFFQCILPCPLWSSESPSAICCSPFQSQSNWSGCRESQNVTNKSSYSARYCVVYGSAIVLIVSSLRHLSFVIYTADSLFLSYWYLFSAVFLCFVHIRLLRVH